MTPTYDQLLKDIESSGVFFSDYDLAFAKENPTAGYGILNAKRDYSAATTDEARALANAAAEQWRNLGGYSAGAEGSGYNPILPSAPQSMGNELLDSKTSQLASFPSYQSNLPAPTWDDRYGAKYDAELNNMLNYAPFSYDYKTDPLYASYKQAYTREGQRASADALGQAAAASGGIPSSFAATAAAQAGNYYAAQLADKIPELYQLAYQQYADQYNRMNNNVGVLQNARSFDYGTYQDALSQYNADRNFDYGVYSDEYNRLASQIGVLTDQDNTAYTRAQAALKAAGRGSGAAAAEPVVDTSPVPFDIWNYVYNSDDPAAVSQYWSRLSDAQKSLISKKYGMSQGELARTGSNVEDVLALMSLSAPKQETVVTPVSAGDIVARPKEMSIYASRLAKDQSKDSKWIDEVESELEQGKITQLEARYLLSLI